MAHYNTLIRNYSSGVATDDDEGISKDYRPFFAINYKNPDDFIDHAVKVLTLLQLDSEKRTENQIRNISFYNGIHTLANYENVRTEDYDRQPVTLENRFVMNHILELTLQKQARLMRGGHELNVRPWNNEYAEKLGARLGKKIIDSTAYTNDFSTLYAEVLLNAFVCGESFLFMEWDKHRGQADPEVERAKQYIEQKVFSEFTNEDGELIKLEEIAQIGDHKFTHPLPFLVLHEPRSRWRDVNYIFKGTLKHIDEIRAENTGMNIPSVAKRRPNTLYSPETEYGEWVIEWEFYHRHHRFVPKGIYAKFFNDTVLQLGELPYEHGELPVARFTDYDDPMNAHGRSFYEDMKLPSVMINNMMKVAYRSFCISAYPKLIMQRDSCNMYSMANGPFVVEVNPGAMEPKIVSFNAVNKDFFPLAQHVEGFMEKNSGVFAMSRGGTIPNARATGILNFYAEQEELRDSSQIAKYTAFQEKVGRHILSNSAQYFKAEDGRTLKIVGKNNRYKLVKIQDNIRLSGSHSVEVVRTTALSESKQGRVDQIVQLSSMPIFGEEGPGLFTREQLLQMIEISDTATFFEMATAAAERASSENEDLFEGLPVEPPKEWQAHLVDWNIHFQYMQSREFSDTEGLPDEVREAYLDHLRTHEMFLYEFAKKNLALAQILNSNKYFPAVFKLDVMDLPLSQIIILLTQPPMMPMVAPAQAEGEAEAAPEEQMEGEEAQPMKEDEPAPKEESKPKKKRLTFTKSNGEQSTADIEELDA